MPVYNTAFQPTVRIFLFKSYTFQPTAFVSLYDILTIPHLAVSPCVSNFLCLSLHFTSTSEIFVSPLSNYVCTVTADSLSPSLNVFALSSMYTVCTYLPWRSIIPIPVQLWLQLFLSVYLYLFQIYIYLPFWVITFQPTNSVYKCLPLSISNLSQCISISG